MVTLMRKPPAALRRLGLGQNPILDEREEVDGPRPAAPDRSKVFLPPLPPDESSLSAAACLRHGKSGRRKGVWGKEEGEKPASRPRGG